MSLLIDTSVVIPYLAGVAYDRLVWVRLVRQQVYVSSVTAMELLAGSLHPDQRSKAEAFIDSLERRERVATPAHVDWLRAGMILARYQNRFGHIEPGYHIGDVLILLTAERLGSDLATENGRHFQLWSRFLSPPKRPRLVLLSRQDHLNALESSS